MAGTAAAWALSSSAAEASYLGEDDNGSYSTEKRYPLGNVVIDTLENTTSDGRDLLRDGTDSIADALRTGAEPGPAEDGRGQDDSDDADERENAAADSEATARALSEQVAAAMDACAGRALSLLESLIGSPENPFEDNPEYQEWRERIEDWFHPGDVLPENPIDGPGVLPAPADWTDVPGAEPTGGGTVVSDGADGATIGVSDSGTSARGTPFGALNTPDFPSGVPTGMPAGALLAPPAPGSGSAGPGQGDGSPMAATFNSGSALNGLLAAMVPSGACNAPFEPGHQPGVTPD